MTPDRIRDDDVRAKLVRAAQREFDAEAARYDVRWARYTRDSLALLRPLLPAQPGRLLDVGCGTASLAAALAAWDAVPSSYVGADVAPAMLRVAREKTAALAFPRALVGASVETLPFPAASFDTAVAASSLHRWPDAAAGLAELRRVLRPGGRLLVVDWDAGHLPVRAVAAWLRARHRTRVRPLRLAELAGAIRAAGFEVGSAGRTRISPIWGLLVVQGTAV